MSQIKQTLTVYVPIADVLLKGDQAAADAVNKAMKENGIPDGTPLEVDVRPRKYDYEVVATWAAPKEGEQQ